MQQAEHFISLNIIGMGVIMFLQAIQWLNHAALPGPVEDRGQGLIEYALILVLVAMVVIVMLVILGPQIGNVYSGIVDSLSNS